MAAIESDVLLPLKLYQYYVVEVESQAALFGPAWSSTLSTTVEVDSNLASLPEHDLVGAFARLCLPKDWDHLAGRYSITVNIPAALSFVSVWTGQSMGADTVAQAVSSFSKLLDIVNVARYELFNSDIKAILDNSRNRIRYTRLDADGPKLGPITAKSVRSHFSFCFADDSHRSPLVESLFIRLPANARTAVHDKKSLALAANGWIWDADPLQDFASSASRTYLRRDLIVWGDCVKLRYGAAPSDNPWLWQHMTNYTESLAGMFDGFRLDNSHSTPIHVGELLLDAARRVNPNLYVCAELFTGSQELDLHFVCKLGLNSLIREAMSTSYRSVVAVLSLIHFVDADDPKRQSQLLYDYGLSKPIGTSQIAQPRCTRTES